MYRPRADRRVEIWTMHGPECRTTPSANPTYVVTPNTSAIEGAGQVRSRPTSRAIARSPANPMEWYVIGLRVIGSCSASMTSHPS